MKRQRNPEKPDPSGARGTPEYKNLAYILHCGTFAHIEKSNHIIELVIEKFYHRKWRTDDDKTD